MSVRRAVQEAKAWAAIYRVVLEELNTHEIETEDVRRKAADIATTILTSPGVRMAG